MEGKGDKGTQLLRRGEGGKALVRTFKITGGDPIQISIPHQPTLLHHGRVSVWSVLCTEAEADEIKEHIEKQSQPTKIEIFCTRQTPEQTAIRKARHGIFVLEFDDEDDS